MSATQTGIKGRQAGALTADTGGEGGSWPAQTPTRRGHSERRAARDTPIGVKGENGSNAIINSSVKALKKPGKKAEMGGCL